MNESEFEGFSTDDENKPTEQEISLMVLESFVELELHLDPNGFILNAELETETGESE